MRATVWQKYENGDQAKDIQRQEIKDDEKKAKNGTEGEEKMKMEESTDQLIKEYKG